MSPRHSRQPVVRGGEDPLAVGREDRGEGLALRWQGHRGKKDLAERRGQPRGRGLRRVPPNRLPREEESHLLREHSCCILLG